MEFCQKLITIQLPVSFHSTEETSNPRRLYYQNMANTDNSQKAALRHQRKKIQAASWGENGALRKTDDWRDFKRLLGSIFWSLGRGGKREEG